MLLRVKRLTPGVHHGSVVAQMRLALSQHVAFLLAVAAANVTVVVAVALVAVAIAGSLVVDLLEPQLAVTAADEVHLFKLFLGEQVCRAAGQHIRWVVGYRVDQRFCHLTGRNASGQRSGGIFHIDSLQLGSLGLQGCDRGLAGLHDLGPDWVYEACQELLVLEEAECVFDAFGLDLDLLC